MEGINTKKNLVYFTIGCDPLYVRLLEFVLATLRDSHLSRPRRNFDIMVMCDAQYSHRLQHLVDDGRIDDIMVVDGINKSGVDCSMRKTEIFRYKRIDRYEKVLYLDCDLIVLGDLESELFSKIQNLDDPRLHVCVERWDIAEHTGEFFGFRDYSMETIAEFARRGIFVFNCGQFAFAVNDAMKRHFEEICSEIEEVKRLGNKKYFYEQSFMNHHFNTRFATAQTLHTVCRVHLPHWPPFAEWPACILHLADSANSAAGKLALMQGYYEEFKGDRDACPKDVRPIPRPRRVLTGPNVSPKQPTAQPTPQPTPKQATSDPAYLNARRVVDMALVAFYCGGPPSEDRDNRRDVGSSRALRPHYLRLTLRNLRTFAKNIVVGICDDRDRTVVMDALDEGTRSAVQILQVPVNGVPWDLPHLLCKVAQEQIGILPKDAIVYYTEADQLTYVDGRHVAFLRQQGPGAYLSGHRIEQTSVLHPESLSYARGGTEEGVGKRGKTKIGFADREWVLANESAPFPPSTGHSSTSSVNLPCYLPANWIKAYSASFLCTVETFTQHARFAIVRPGKPPAGLSLEAPSLSMYESCRCFKTQAVHDLMTIHLGDYEYVVSDIYGKDTPETADIVLRNLDDLARKINLPFFSRGPDLDG